MESGTQSGMDSRSLPRSLACCRACMVNATDATTESYMEDRFRCEQGFSPLQINILGVLKAHSDVLSYSHIAKLVGQHYRMPVTEGATRGALERLFPREFLLRSRASKGRLRGNRYAWATDPCPHIQPCTFMEASTGLAAQSAPNSAASFLKEEIDRRNLSISSQSPAAERLLEELSETGIAFHWPALAQSGFGTHQIRQILQSLSKIAIPAGHVMRGLAYANWELENGLMRDKEGQAVADPCSYVFLSLARNGCYRKPANYVDPLEVAEQEAITEAKRRQQASEERAQAEMQAKFAEGFEQWLAGTRSEETQRIVAAAGNGSLRIPADVVLRNHYRTHVAGKQPEADPT